MTGLGELQNTDKASASICKDKAQSLGSHCCSVNELYILYTCDLAINTVKPKHYTPSPQCKFTHGRGITDIQI